MHSGELPKSVISLSPHKIHVISSLCVGILLPSQASYFALTYFPDQYFFILLKTWSESIFPFFFLVEKSKKVELKLEIISSYYSVFSHVPLIALSCLRTSEYISFSLACCSK